MDGLPRRKRLRLKEFDYSAPRAYYVTICCKEKRLIFTTDALNSKVIDCLKEERVRLGFKVYVYSVMPDHIHLLLSPEESSTSVSRFVGGFKSKVAGICRESGIEGKIWQRSFYDHIVRKTEDLTQIAEYVLNNAVRRGLVEKAADFKYSGCLDPLPV